VVEFVAFWPSLLLPKLVGEVMDARGIKQRQGPFIEMISELARLPGSADSLQPLTSTSIPQSGQVRPTGGLSGCVAELRAAGIAEDRKEWLCGCSKGQRVIGEAEKADLLATNQGVQGKINGCEWVPAHETQAAGTAPMP
jgi:hypothetical protein